MDVNNLKAALKAIAFIALGTGIAAMFAMVSAILIGVFAYQVELGNIPVTSAVNTTVQSIATTATAAVVVVVGLLSLVAGIASIVIIVLTLLGKIDFAGVAGMGGKGKNF